MDRQLVVVVVLPLVLHHGQATPARLQHPHTCPQAPRLGQEGLHPQGSLHGRQRREVQAWRHQVALAVRQVPLVVTQACPALQWVRYRHQEPT